nr:hypothetical protein [Candidatus Eremiobacteraeota bacterium]
GTGQVDGVEIDDEQGNSPLLSRSGADIGDVAASQERRIEIAYSVAGAIENGSTVELQAAVAAFEIAPVGSNVVRLIARSQPVLQNALSTITIEGRAEARPGSEALVTVRVHNAGQSSAHDVMIVAPIPDNTTYIANSARVGGRELEREMTQRFDSVHAPVIAKALPASATATLTYRIRLDDPLAGGTIISARAIIASQESAAFKLEPATLSVTAQPSFDNDQTGFAIEPENEAAPGQRVTLRLRIANTGTTGAEDVSAALTMPEGLLAVHGAGRIDGRPMRERKKDAGAFDLGTIAARSSVEVVAEAIVASPSVNGATIPIGAVLRWNGGERPFERNLTIRSEPFLAPRRNHIERIGNPTVSPGDEIETAIVIANDGSAPVTGAVLQIRIDPALEDLRLTEKNLKLSLDGEAAQIGALEPYATRRFSLRARIKTPYSDRSAVRLGASLQSRELGETNLGDVVYTVDSHPAFSTERSKLELSSAEMLRPNQQTDVLVHITNEGTDVAQNVRLRLYISPEASLESVDGAAREGASLVLGEVAPGSTVHARLGLRLLRSLAREYPVSIEGVLSAESVLPVPLEKLAIVTTAEPDFAIGTFRSDPPEVVDVGEMVEYIMHVRNGGDGPAHRVKITVEPLETLIYVPGSTTVNDVNVRDVGAGAPFVSERGIVLNDVDPGVEAVIRWREVVHNGLAAGEAIVRSAKISYDGDRADSIRSCELNVRSVPSFANNIPGLPFGLDGMIGPAFVGTQTALPNADDRFVELPPATPVAMNGDYHTTRTALQSGEILDEQSEPHVTAATTALDATRLGRALRFVDEARNGNLVSHLFALRAFFPDALNPSTPELEDALAAQRAGLLELTNQLFIKLRVSSYNLIETDIETPSSRTTLLQFLESVCENADTPRSPDSEPQLHGTLDLDHLRAGLDELREAPLGSANAWIALAEFLPNSTNELRAYREQLIAALGGLSHRSPAQFLAALERGASPELDGALQAVCESFRANRV